MLHSNDGATNGIFSWLTRNAQMADTGAVGPNLKRPAFASLQNSGLSRPRTS
jgi:hypothetical protein